MAGSRGVGSRLEDVTSRVRQIVQRLGWTHALLWLCSALGRRASIHILVITVHRIDQHTEDVRPENAALEMRFLSDEEVLRFASDDAYRYSSAFAVDALARGDRCFGILERGHLICYCWYASGPAPIFDGLAVVVDFPFMYGYNAFTDPNHRGRGLHVLGIAAAARELREAGFSAFTAYIEADNVAPLLAARKMGEHFVGFVVLYRWLGEFRWIATRGCANAGLRMTRRIPTEYDRRGKVAVKTRGPV